MTRHFDKFCRREDGGPTVESILWLGFFVMLFGLLVDVAMIFNGQARALRVVQDQTRDFSVGELTTVDELRTEITNELQALQINPSAVNSIVIAGVVSTRVEIPANQLAIVGFFTSFPGLQVDVVADMMIENWEV